MFEGLYLMTAQGGIKMNHYLLKQGIIVTDTEEFLGSIEVKDGKIKKVYRSGEVLPELAEIDLKGKYVFPGFMDSHVHMNEPGDSSREDLYHATAAAALAGITTVIDMPNSNTPVITDAKCLAMKIDCIEKNANINVAAWGALVNYNFEHLKELHDAGVKVFKSFLCDPDKGYTMLTNEEIRKAMKIVKEFDGVIGFHCEDNAVLQEYKKKALEEDGDTRIGYLHSRPVKAEYESAMEVIAAAKETGCTTYICHTSHPMILEAIEKAKEEGYKIYAESCPHYLLFTQDKYLEYGGRFKCCPPIRDHEARKGLLECFKNGKIDTIGSDHCPVPISFKEEEKYGCIDLFNGMSGLQSAVMAAFDYLVNQNGVSTSLFAKAFSSNIAKIFGLGDRKGAIKETYDADLTIVDPEKEWCVKPEELMYVNQYSPYDGCKGKGCAVMTILGGEIIMQDGVLLLERKGTFVAGK